MTNDMKIEALAEHRYLVRRRQGDDTVEILVRLAPDVTARLGYDPADEVRIVEATVAFLVARQRPDDLPPQLDVDDIAAAYEDFEGELRQRLHGRDGGTA